MRAAFLMIFGLFALLPGPAAAEPVFDDPVALIQYVYEPYLRGEIEDYPVAVYTPTLRQLWDSAMARSEEIDMPVLDYDPFVNAQDFDISELVVADPMVDGDNAMVTVGFLNFGQPTELRFILVRRVDGWKIDDIVTEDGEIVWRLSEVLASDPMLN